MTKITLGVNVTGQYFDAARLENDIYEIGNFANTPNGFTDFAVWLENFGDSESLVCIAHTRGYGSDLADFLLHSGYQVAVTRPGTIEAYAQKRQELGDNYEHVLADSSASIAQLAARYAPEMLAEKTEKKPLLCLWNGTKLIQRFADDLIDVAAEAMASEHADKRRQRLYAGLLTIFTRSERRYYCRRLLFLDYSDSQAMDKIVAEDGTLRSVPAEASVYMDRIWHGRLQAANKLKGGVGSAQQLFTRLCQLHRDFRWSTAAIERRHGLSAPQALPLLAGFATTHAALSGQCAALGESYNTTAQKQRKKFGIPWLRIQEIQAAIAEVPEEQSLADVFNACPLPLKADFAQDKDFRYRLSNVVKHLNERYSALRACGLNFNTWFEKTVTTRRFKKPKLLSHDDLDELRILRRKAIIAKNTDKDTQLWVDGDVEEAYRQAFEALLAEKEAPKRGQKHLAGFMSFAEWQNSEVGRDMLGRAWRPASVDATQTTMSNQEPASDDGAEAKDDSDDIDMEDDGTDSGFSEEDNDEAAVEATVSIDSFAIDSNELYELLVDRFPEDFSPVMAYFFAEYYGAPNRAEDFCEDTTFLRLVGYDPSYAHLLQGDIHSEEDALKRINLLEDALIRDAQVLQERNQNKWRQSLAHANPRHLNHYSYR